MNKTYLVIVIIGIVLWGAVCVGSLFLLWQSRRRRTPQISQANQPRQPKNWWGPGQKAVLAGFGLCVFALVLFPTQAKTLWSNTPMMIAFVVAVVILAATTKKQGEGFVNIARFVAIIAVMGILGYHFTPANVKSEVLGWFSPSDNRTIEDRFQTIEVIVPPDSLIKVPVLCKRGNILRIEQLTSPSEYTIVCRGYEVAVRNRLYQTRIRVGTRDERSRLEDRDPNLWIRGGKEPVHLFISVIPN